MASLYNLEPQPTAKVILHTTTGDLLLELWGAQAPLATRNFLQHCLDSYYTNTIFHRLVPNFILQGGDPTGTGSGGISAINNGDGFEDELHSRLKFNRRGLLGMANEGKGSNGSQFFLTLGATPELQGKHTMFGRVEGETIYNLIKMGEAEMGEGEGSERPLYPTRIIGTEVLVNPFEDMVARVKEAPRTGREEESVKKRKKPAGRNVLSFGGDEGEDTVSTPVLKKAKVNPKLVVVEDAASLEDEGAAVVDKVPTQKKAKPTVSRKPSSPEPEVRAAAPVRSPQPPERMDLDDDEDEPAEELRSSKAQTALEKTNAEIAAIKASMKRTTDTTATRHEKPKSLLEAMIPANSTRARKRGKPTDDKSSFDLFNAWKKQLDETPSAEPPIATNGTQKTSTDPSADPAPADAADDDEATLCDLHFITNCQSCKSWDEGQPDHEADEDGDDDPGWMSHRLVAAKDRLGKDLEWKKRMDEIEIIDPREKAREIKEAAKRGKERGNGKGRAYVDYDMIITQQK
ncbi:Peptidyl-prolyl isomerase cwc27 [Oleoguttula sp. CCFEE 5521]